MALCKFCRGEEGPNEATQTITLVSGTPFPACDDCAAEWEEVNYQDYIAEQTYQDYIDGEPLASVDHARLLGRIE